MYKIAIFAGLLTAAPAFAQTPLKAKADLKNAEGKSVGAATLEEGPEGVLITVEVSGLEPGAKGFHLHETGKCQGPDFKSAGGHFNPDKHEHGFFAAKGPHAGDLPNLWVDEGGRAKVSAFNEEITLKAGDEDSLFDQDGTAIVVHAGADDYKTNPAGGSGDRIACGVIEQVK